MMQMERKNGVYDSMYKENCLRGLPHLKKTCITIPSRKRSKIQFYILFCIVKPNLPINFQEETWEKLKLAVNAIHEKKAIAYSLEELYKAVENMCSHKMASPLYDKLKEECEKHVRANINQFT